MGKGVKDVSIIYYHEMTRLYVYIYIYIIIYIRLTYVLQYIYTVYGQECIYDATGWSGFDSKVFAVSFGVTCVVGP